MFWCQFFFSFSSSQFKEFDEKERNGDEGSKEEEEEESVSHDL